MVVITPFSTQFMKKFGRCTHLNVSCVFTFKGFHGTTGNTVVYRAFEWKFIAKKIRIYVLGWYIWPCMRIELYHTGKVVWGRVEIKRLSGEQLISERYFSVRN